MNKWTKAELSEGKEIAIPLTGETVALYCCPRNEKDRLFCDLGSLDFEEEDGLTWGSAFGIDSCLDGLKFEDILRNYDVCFASVPPLENGRFPPPLGIVQ